MPVYLFIPDSSCLCAIKKQNATANAAYSRVVIGYGLVVFMSCDIFYTVFIRVRLIQNVHSISAIPTTSQDTSL